MASTVFDTLWSREAGALGPSTALRFLINDEKFEMPIIEAAIQITAVCIGVSRNSADHLPDAQIAASGFRLWISH